MAVTAITENMELCCHVYETMAQQLVSDGVLTGTQANIGFLLALKDARNTRNSTLQDLVRQGWGVGSGEFNENDCPVFRFTSDDEIIMNVQNERLPACEQGDLTDVTKSKFEFVPDIINSIKITLTKNELSLLCSETPSERQTRLLLKAAEDILKAENETLLALALERAGEYSNGLEGVSSLTNPIQINLLNAQYTAVNPTVEPMVLQAYGSIGINEMPIMIGGALAGFAEKLSAKTLGLNQNGQDTRMQNSVIYDPRIDTLFADGNSHLFTWAPTALQSAEWFKHFNVQTDENDTVVRRIIELPVAGRNWQFDYSLHYDACDEVYVITLTRQTGLFDYMTKGILHFLIACGEFSCEDLVPLISNGTEAEIVA